jgi:hypothetical protein
MCASTLAWTSTSGRREFGKRFLIVAQLYSFFQQCSLSSPCSLVSPPQWGWGLERKVVHSGHICAGHQFQEAHYGQCWFGRVIGYCCCLDKINPLFSKL